VSLWHLRRPPLFPYTTLFRSVADDVGLAVDFGVGGIEGGHVAESLDHREPDDVGEAELAAARALQVVVGDAPVDLEQLGGNRPRSEEHTSELQSPDQLVCRLL